MANAAHGESLEHEVYHTPFKVEPEFEDRKTPANYHDRHIGTDKLPDKMKVWKVQTSERGNVVSRSYGFEDSPDAEAIALGFNHGKEYGAVGIGRHANVLQWGYFDPPSQMTDAGRRLFLNCICYIHRFDGVRPLVHTNASHRLNAIRLAPLIDRIDDKSFFSSTFAPELMEKYKGNAKGLADYYRQDIELVYRDSRGGGTFQIDTDLKELSLESNRTVETLGRLIELLGDPQQAEKAGRLLERYTSQSNDFSSAEQWRQWLSENKDRIFFSDVGGYKFFVIPEGYPVGQKNQTEIGRALFR
ncbi:MAG TPA: hypothetical protein VMW24_06460 [Sedimentisphaerales bacterium]|nr:hypothetical protein [Sedimentisphaerales bacterium]